MSLTPAAATLLGIVEGLTEFLPVSSTGHLILTASLLRISGEAVKTFEVVIQAGAVAAVVMLYRQRVASLVRGLIGKDPLGRRFLWMLCVSFLPAALVGLSFHGGIKQRLFQPWSVVAALALGGAVMIAVDAWLRRPRAGQDRGLESIKTQEALWIGLAQCLSLWPGTSRAMVTLVAAMALGFSAPRAAEYSFLLAIPTLGAAVLFDAVRGADGLWKGIGPISILCGFLSATVVAVLAVRGLVRYLNKQGLALFGWYRLVLAGAVWWIYAR